MNGVENYLVATFGIYVAGNCIVEYFKYKIKMKQLSQENKSE